MKLEGDFAVTPAVVTVIGPLVAPTGTIAVSTVVDVEVGAAASVPLNFTTLLPAASKFKPLMVTVVPAVPRSGVKLFTVGVVIADVIAKVKCETAVPPEPGVVTVMFPLIASGTVTISDVAEADVTVARVPLKVTMLFPGVASNPVP